MRLTIPILALLFSIGPAHATRCLDVPACEMVRANSILFVATAEARPDGRRVEVTVREVFSGISPDTRRLTVVAESDLIRPGMTYLFDLFVDGEGSYSADGICGRTAEIDWPGNAALLSFLRERARGNTLTTVNVRVQEQRFPLNGVEVALRGPDGAVLLGTTGTNGIASFAAVPPGEYAVSTAKANYRDSGRNGTEDRVTAMAGACSTAWSPMESTSSLTLRVANRLGSPAGGMEVELVAAPDHPGDNFADGGLFYVETTDREGKARFPSVAPGRYVLGINVLELEPGPIPPIYYPGIRDRAMTVPIEVRSGEHTDNLVLTLPDR